MFNEIGILENDEENKLVLFFQGYLEDRFEFMDKKVDIFDYMEFTKDLGLWYWNNNLIEMVRDYFSKNFHDYDMNQLSRLIKIVAYNHEKSDEILTIIEDSMKIRVTHSIKTGEALDMDNDGLLALTEGIAVLGIRRTRMVSLLKRILLEL